MGPYVTESTGIGGSKTVEIKKIDRDPSQQLINLFFSVHTDWIACMVKSLNKRHFLPNQPIFFAK